MYEALIIDTETTGNDPLEVIELAAMIAAFGNMKPIEVINSRFRPTHPITYGAMATHHILLDDLVGLPPSSEAVLPECKYIIAHNVDYDWQALGKPDVKRICTLAIARHLWPELDSHKLGAVAYFLFGHAAKSWVKNCHRAMEDVQLLRMVFREMLHKIPAANWEEVWEFSERARIPTVMPFGKHKGMDIKDVSADYKQWLLKQSDIDEYLRKALA